MLQSYRMITEFKHNYFNVLLFVKIISGHSCVEVPEISQLNRFRLELYKTFQWALNDCKLGLSMKPYLIHRKSGRNFLDVKLIIEGFWLNPIHPQTVVLYRVENWSPDERRKIWMTGRLSVQWLPLHPGPFVEAYYSCRYENFHRIFEHDDIFIWQLLIVVLENSS